MALILYSSFPRSLGARGGKRHARRRDNETRRFTGKIAVELMGDSFWDGDRAKPSWSLYGCEATIHPTRQWMVPHAALLVVDLRNAFNSVDRSYVLRQFGPISFLRVATCAISTRRKLFFGHKCISSARVVQLPWDRHS